LSPRDCSPARLWFLFFYTKSGILHANCAVPTLEKLTGHHQQCLKITGSFAFDSDLLVPIRVDQFDLIDCEINMGVEGMLANLCSNQLWGQLLFDFQNCNVGG
jgi:hypothetical protein